MKTKTLLLAAAAALLSSCNGPWNMMVEDGGRGQPKLWVSHFAVADLPFDTLWLERPWKLTDAFDSTLQFVDTARTTIRVIRDDLRDTLVFRPVPGLGNAWLPVRSLVVARGATYRLDARVVWRDADGGVRDDQLSATTRVPRVYRLFDWGLAPIEALVPWAGEVDSVAKAPEARRAILDRYALTDKTLDSIRRNLPVYRQVAKGDTVWYIHDETRVPDIAGAEVQRAFRNYLFAQEMERDDWAGVLAVQNWDPEGSFVLNIIQKQFLRSSGETKIDSVGLYQEGNLRTLTLEPGYNPGKGLPPSVTGVLDTLARFTGTDIQPWTLSNALLGYTGRNVIRLYALDENHYEYLSRLQNAGNANTLRFSNVSGGDGYFSSAASDSFPLFVRATQDTFSVRSLRTAWCRDRRDGAAKAGDPWDPGPLCSDLGFTALD